MTVHQPDQKQQQCISSTPEYPLVIIAGPGSGKTEVLCRRIEYLSSCGIDENQILCLTFTAKAASEMRNRLSKSQKTKATVQTIHACGFDVLQKFGEQTGTYTSKVKLATKKVIEDVTTNCQDPENTKKTHNICEFSDMVTGAIAMLSRETISLSWKHVLVDEFQDTSNDQWKLITSLVRCSRECSVTVVGDLNQSIYQFRGADSEIFASFHDTFPNARIRTLVKNYRCHVNIAKVATEFASLNLKYPVSGKNSNFIKKLEEQIYKLNNSQFQSSRKLTNNVVTVVEHNTVAEELEWISECVKKILNENITNTVGVLCRIREPLSDVKSALKPLMEQPVSVFTKKNRQLGGSYARLASGQATKQDLVVVVTNEFQCWGLDKRTPQYKQFMKSIYNLDQNMFGNEVLTEIDKKDQKKNKKNNSIENDQPKLLMFFESSKSTSESTSSKVMSEAFQFMKKLTEVIASDECTISIPFTNSLKKRFGVASESELLQLVRMPSLSGSKQSRTRITISTIHGSKGLEFTHVIIIGCCESVMPGTMYSDIPMATENNLSESHDLGYLISQFREERRICYVGMTRASDRLFLSCPTSSQSRFVREILSVDTDGLVTVVPPPELKSSNLFNSLRPSTSFISGNGSTLGIVTGCKSFRPPRKVEENNTKVSSTDSFLSTIKNCDSRQQQSPSGIVIGCKSFRPPRKVVPTHNDTKHPEGSNNKDSLSESEQPDKVNSINNGLSTSVIVSNKEDEILDEAAQRSYSDDDSSTTEVVDLRCKQPELNQTAFNYEVTSSTPPDKAIQQAACLIQIDSPLSSIDSPVCIPKQFVNYCAPVTVAEPPKLSHQTINKIINNKGKSSDVVTAVAEQSSQKKDRPGRPPRSISPVSGLAPEKTTKLKKKRSAEQKSVKKLRKKGSFTDTCCTPPVAVKVRGKESKSRSVSPTSQLKVSNDVTPPRPRRGGGLKTPPWQQQITHFIKPQNVKPTKLIEITNTFNNNEHPSCSPTSASDLELLSNVEDGYTASARFVVSGHCEICDSIASSKSLLSYKQSGEGYCDMCSASVELLLSIKYSLHDCTYIESVPLTQSREELRSLMEAKSPSELLLNERGVFWSAIWHFGSLKV